MKSSKIILLCSLAFSLSNQCMGMQTKDNSHSLFDAIINHDFEKVTEVTKNNKESINSQDKDGNYPLHLALYQGSTEIAAFLIKEGANIHIQDSANCTPLQIAEAKNNQKIVKLLTELNAVYSAIIYSDFQQVKKLIEKNKALINIKNQDGFTPLHIALYTTSTEEQDSIEIAKFLIDKGADINAQDELGNTPLHIAIEKGNTAIAKLLIEKKIFFFFQAANINIQNKEGDTPLHIAIQKGSTEIAELLMSKGADLHAHNRFGNTPLYIAIEKGNTTIAKLLIEKGANINDAAKYIIYMINNIINTIKQYKYVNSDDVEKLIVENLILQLLSELEIALEKGQIIPQNLRSQLFSKIMNESIFYLNSLVCYSKNFLAMYDKINDMNEKIEDFVIEEHLREHLRTIRLKIKVVSSQK